MKITRNAALLALLLLQGALIAFVYLGGRSGDPDQLPAFFPGLDPESIVGLRLVDGESGATVLEKEGQGWVVRSADNLPADPARIKQVLEKLVSLRAERLVARTRESHGRFLVGKNKYERLVTLTLADGTGKSLYLGSAPSYKSTHVRMEGDDRVYLLKEFSGWEIPRDLSSWWLADYVDLADQALGEVRVTNSSGSVVLRRDNGDTWRVEGLPAGKSPDPARVQEFIDGVRHITLSEYLGTEEQKEYGLASPRATLTLVGRDGNSTVLAIGARDEVSGTFFMKSSASPFYARGSAAVLAPLFIDGPGRLLAGEQPGQR